MPELERSPEFSRKLEEVRRMPQETEEENAEKREAAKLLRMEVMLDNAKCARVMVEALKENPKITVAEMQAQVARQANIIHPEVAAAFAVELASTSERVAENVKGLKNESDEKKQGMAKLLYRRLLTDQLRKPKRGQLRLPQGGVKLGGVYPLAVQLDVMDDSDFASIHEGRLTRVLRPEGLKQGRAFHKAVADKGSIDEIIEQLEGNFVDFPVIVVRPGTEKNDDWQVRKHEQGHAENRVFREVLTKKGKKFVWGEPAWDAGATNNQLSQLWEEDEDKARDSVYWKQIQKMAAVYAKDELLADMAAGEGKILSSKSLNRLQYGPYDYFRELGIDPKSSLHKALREEYVQTLSAAAEKLGNITSGYSAMGLNERVELLRWVAAQMPLGEWPRQLNAANFQWEANRLRRISRFYSDGLKGGDEMENGRRKDLIHDLLGEMKQMQDKPLGEVLSRYEGYFRIPDDFV